MSEKGVALFVAHDDGLVSDPHYLPVAGQHPALCLERLEGLVGTGVLAKQVLAVIGVDQLEPVLRAGDLL